jgi:hypothetical protein
MTEADWLASTDLDAMLGFLTDRASLRQLRLFACACCRQVWDQLTDPRSRKAVELSEQFADGLIDARALGEARKEAWHCSSSNTPHPPTAAWQAARPVVDEEGVVGMNFSWIWSVCPDLAPFFLRDIVGNPFQKVSRDRDWLRWNRGTVPKLARVIYEERAWERMPILGDALEDAGCTEPAILAHCHSPGPHVLGCFVVDMLLTKK